MAALHILGNATKEAYPSFSDHFWTSVNAFQQVWEDTWIIDNTQYTLALHTLFDTITTLYIYTDEYKLIIKDLYLSFCFGMKKFLPQEINLNCE